MRGKEACSNSGHAVQDHFEELLGMVNIALSQEQNKVGGLEMIPNGWKKKPLSSVAHIQTGIAKGAKKTKNPIELPYLRVANVQDGYLDLSHIKTIEIDIAQTERYLLQIGDVLLTEGGDFDKLGRGSV